MSKELCLRKLIQPKNVTGVNTFLSVFKDSQLPNDNLTNCNFLVNVYIFHQLIFRTRHKIGIMKQE